MYKSWGEVFCPALKSKVKFTNLGWDHLVERKKRTKVEKSKRLELLPFVKKILKNSHTIQGTRFQDGINYWEFISIQNNKKLTVLVSKKKSEFTFFSIFEM